MADQSLMTDEELRARYPGAPKDVDLRAQDSQAAPPRTREQPKFPGDYPSHDRLAPPEAKTEAPVPPPAAPPSEDWPQPGGAKRDETTTDDDDDSGWVKKRKTKSKKDADTDDLELVTPGMSRDEAGLAGAKTKGAGFFGDFKVPVTVTKVHDGDTFYATTPGSTKLRRVRIRGIDAPELDPAGTGPGIKAREALQQMLARGGVVLSGITEDRYGRAFATVSVNGIPDVGEALTKAGFATRIDLPKDWPKDNEWRKIHATAPADKIAYIKWITEMSRRLAGMIHQGTIKKSDSKQYAAFIEQAEKLMKEYIRPWRKSRGIVSAEEAFPSLKGKDGASAAPGAPPGAAPPTDSPKFDFQKAFADLDRPVGRSEWASWEKSLWPEEKQQWRQLRILEQYFAHNMPRDAENRARAQQDPDYLKFKRYFEKFLNLTTKRWRAHQERYRPGRRRRSEMEAPQPVQVAAGDEDMAQALGAMS